MNIIPTVKSSLIFIISLVLLCQCETQTEKTNTEENCKEEKCCSKESSTAQSETSEITCPECGHTKAETLPTEQCMIKYTCENCGSELTPIGGDCCVFCSYGTHKCPSKQDE